MLLVSHDRDFLDRVVTSVIATEGDGRWIEYAGGYTKQAFNRVWLIEATIARSGAAKYLAGGERQLWG